jgi:cytochrome c oxidase subunit III
MNQTSTSPAHGGAEQHADHEHAPFLAHHFDSPQQQFDAGKLGMWLFLITEILFFSGLFVLYAVYRARHPEVFADAHQYLDKTLGAVNTVVLLFSSLTMAWAVRCAQLSQRRGLIACLITTLACASLFLGVKAIEYSHKWDMGLFWAGMFQPHGDHHANQGLSPFLLGLSAPAMLALIVFVTGTIVAYVKKRPQALIVWGGLAIASAAFFVGVGSAMIIPKLVGPLMPAAHHEAAPVIDHSSDHAAHELDGEPATEAEAETEPPFSYAGIFFSIYFAMTGVHAVHILAGMGVIAWLLVRSVRGDFTSQYFGPVDYVGLYWHLVDLVWIYLFPLLYLIH